MRPTFYVLIREQVLLALVLLAVALLDAVCCSTSNQSDEQSACCFFAALRPLSDRTLSARAEAIARPPLVRQHGGVPQEIQPATFPPLGAARQRLLEAPFRQEGALLAPLVPRSHPPSCRSAKHCTKHFVDAATSCPPIFFCGVG